MNLIKTLYVLAVLCSAFPVFSQTNRSLEASSRCTQNLSLAEDQYKAGILQGIPDRLNSCLRAGNFSKEETIRAYKLLTLVYIFDDNEKLADDNMVQLLKADPEHAYDIIADPAEFIFLYNKYRTKPIFRIGVTFSNSITSANVIRSFNSNPVNRETKSYATGTGLGAAISIEKEFFNYFEGVFSVGYFNKQFSYTQSDFGFETDPSPNDNPSRGFSVLESQNWLDANVGVRAFYPLGNFRPYVYLGGAVNYLQSAAETGTRGAVSTSNINLVETENREQLNFSLVYGAGVKIKQKVNFVNFEVRYMNGLTNVVQGDNRFPLPQSFQANTINDIEDQRQNRLYSVGIVDDNFSVNSLFFSIGYIKSFYNPKKLNGYR